MNITQAESKIDIRSSPLLVVTDLDGTLLDHDSYSYSPAIPALKALGARKVPVILCSSKTRTEIGRIRQDMGNNAPFVVENGAAIVEGDVLNGASRAGVSDIVLGVAYEKVLATLHELRETFEFKFRGFNDMSVEEVAEVTGLSVHDSAMAKAREYSEPLIWQDSVPRREVFLQELSKRGLLAQQGGRFLTVAGNTSKGHAVAELRRLYGTRTPLVIVALGDSPNDESMLNAADIAVVIKSDKSADMKISGPEKIIYTTERGPVGWNSAIQEILED